jgi:hypothetical protein
VKNAARARGAATPFDDVAAGSAGGCPKQPSPLPFGCTLSDRYGNAQSSLLVSFAAICSAIAASSCSPFAADAASGWPQTPDDEIAPSVRHR